MAWSTPRTWNSGETVTAALMNAHVRDNMNVLKTYLDDDGSLRTLVKGFAFSSGQGNNAGGADTQLTSYNVTIPADFLSQPGDALIVEGVLSLANNTNSKTFKVKVGGGSTVTVLTNAAAVSGHIVPFRLVISRRTATDGAVSGYALEGAAHGGTATVEMTSAGTGTVAWGSSQTLAVFAAASGANDIKLADYWVYHVRGLSGSTV